MQWLHADLLRYAPILDILREKHQMAFPDSTGIISDDCILIRWHPTQCNVTCFIVFSHVKVKKRWKNMPFSESKLIVLQCLLNEYRSFSKPLLVMPKSTDTMDVELHFVISVVLAKAFKLTIWPCESLCGNYLVRSISMLKLPQDQDHDIAVIPYDHWFTLISYTFIQ